MRTTIRMNEELARRAKKYAARHHRTFTEIVELAVVELLARERGQNRTSAARLELPVVGDPTRRISEDEYRRAVEEIYDEEARDVLRNAQ